MPWSRTKLKPWIKDLILGYDHTLAEQETKSVRLKAHVVGCAPMALSQAQGAQGGPTDVLFLSDGVVQMPAVLTASAWDDLQEREDRDSFSSLINTTVCMQAHQLQFYLNPEQTKSRFFLCVSKLASVAAGPPKDMPPSCTTLAAVKEQICKTWSSLMPQAQGPSAYSQQSQDTQSFFDLSTLLGAWQDGEDDALEDSVLESVEDGVRVAPPCPVSPQPSTSSRDPPSHHANAHTGWDADRIRCKSVEQFSIPVCRLLMPEEEAQTASEQGSERQSGILNPPEDTNTDLPITAHRLETVQTILGLPESEVLERGSTGSEEKLSRYLSPPFVILSSSDEDESITSEAIPPKDLPDTAGTTVQAKGVVPLAASTQMSSKGPSSEMSQTSEQSKEQTSIPPYQKPRSTPRLVPTSNSSASGSTASDQGNLQEVEEETETREEGARRKRRAVKPKMKNRCSPGALTAEEEGVHPSGSHPSGSPPSWLFETQRASGAEARSSLKQTKPVGTVSGGVHSTVHSDGTQFSYAYKPPTDQLLQDLSKFQVTDDMLRWAVKCLTVPNQTDNAHSSVSER